MASISTDSAGNRTIQFVCSDRNRRSIRLGKVSMKLAEKIRDKVEDLNSAKLHHTPPPEHVVAWLKKIGDDLHAKLAAVGLVDPRQGSNSTLGAFLREYIDRRTDVRPNTRRNLEQSHGYLVNFFGESRLLRKITAADADAFGFDMKGRYAEATAARVIKHARQFFTSARRGNLVDADPFAEVKPGSMTNEDRLYFVDRDTADCRMS